MLSDPYSFKAEVWLYEGMAGWHFVTVPKKLSQELTDEFGVIKRGWGSLPVQVIVGKTEWRTSIFPDKKASAYLLPLKAEVRKKEDITTGDTITLTLRIRI